MSCPRVQSCLQALRQHRMRSGPTKTACWPSRGTRKCPLRMRCRRYGHSCHLMGMSFSLLICVFILRMAGSTCMIAHVLTADYYTHDDIFPCAWPLMLQISMESSLILIARKQDAHSSGATCMQEAEQRGIGSQQSSPREHQAGLCHDPEHDAGFHHQQCRSRTISR